MEVQEAERPQLALPAVAAPSRSHPQAQPRAAARSVVARWADRRAWAAHWDDPLRVAIKGLLLTCIVALGIVLAGYAGVLRLLPDTPPRLEVVSAAQHARVTPWTYCWLSSGAGGCTDGTPGTGQTPRAPIAIAPGQTVELRFGYPTPTTCVATGAVAPAAGMPLKLLPLRPDALSTGFALVSPPAPGTYDVSVSCDWNPHRSLRWLRGFGHATYALTLRVAAQ